MSTIEANFLGQPKGNQNKTHLLLSVPREIRLPERSATEIDRDQFYLRAYYSCESFEYRNIDVVVYIFLNLLILSNFPLLWLFQNNLAIIHSIIINIIGTIENHKYKYNPLCSNSSIFFISFVLITFFHLHSWLADSAQANVCFSSR